MKILIVCASNICRSPYVEYLLRREISNNKLLNDKIEWVKSSAVFNKMKSIHPKAKIALLKEGFEDSEIDRHKPSYIFCDYSRFREADVIIGMTRLQKYLMPPWLHKKYLTLSEAAGHKYITIKDPYLEKTQEGYDKVMLQLKDYVHDYISELERKYSE